MFFILSIIVSCTFSGPLKYNEGPKYRVISPVGAKLGTRVSKKLRPVATGSAAVVESALIHTKKGFFPGKLFLRANQKAERKV